MNLLNFNKKLFVLPLNCYYSKYNELIIDISDIIDCTIIEVLNVLANICNKNIGNISKYRQPNKNLCFLNSYDDSKNYVINKDYYIIFYELKDIVDLLSMYIDKHINFDVIENITLNPTSNIISISLYDYYKYIIDDYSNIKSIIIKFAFRNIKAFIEFNIKYINNIIYLIPNFNNYLNYDDKINDYIPYKFDL